MESFTLLGFLVLGGGESKTLLDSSFRELLFLLDRLNVGGEARGVVGLGVFLTALARLAPLILLLGEYLERMWKV